MTDGERPSPAGLLFPAGRDGREGPGAASPSLGAPGEGRAQPSLCLQVTPFPEPYRDTLQPYKISEQDTDVRAGPVPSLCPLSPPGRALSSSGINLPLSLGLAPSPSLSHVTPKSLQ